MISKAYVIPDIEIVEFSLEDVLTKSAVIHTTTTLPATTSSGGIQIGDNIGQGDIVFNPSEYFQ